MSGHPSNKVFNPQKPAFYAILLCMELRSARSFLKVGLFLGSYCQQWFIILAISTGQEWGAGIRYPEKHHSQSAQGARDFCHISLTCLEQQRGQRSVFACGGCGFPLGYLLFSDEVFYLSPPHPASAGWSCSCKVSDPEKKSPTAKYRSSTRHSLWYSDLQTPAGGSIGEVTGQE